MEGRLVHHAMEWLTRVYKDSGKHATRLALAQQLKAYFRVLWARGIRTAFESKQDTIDRVLENLFPGGSAGTIHSTVKAAIEGAQHTEYELKTVKKLIRADFAGKSRLLLTGVLDLVIQQMHPLTYLRVWRWTDLASLKGVVSKETVPAAPGDIEIWDYKATRADTKYVGDYVRQLLTYAALYKEKAAELPTRCVLFFVNEKKEEDCLLAVEVDESIVAAALQWTIEQVKFLRNTTLAFQNSPLSVEGGGLEEKAMPIGQRICEDQKQQCTACGFRFDCKEYCTYLGGNHQSDVRLTNVRKN
jgi:hypothetical protein